ncbi:hypothetical protein BDZ90DRAFT_77052 [Jaminaea rosea]|uniref:Uncharacterized protein n=1 Tax=Jaminaea rosea TaxID=1569628 RepID=A0A316UPN4_9BASI|nr:hypothetical protein BDZ90DRAFT_77052 [Jaminaea rosea]PWN25095.1 hypothetical protein BDZ90DRAFT_77052 [Jaminaea rosea]
MLCRPPSRCTRRRLAALSRLVAPGIASTRQLLHSQALYIAFAPSSGLEVRLGGMRHADRSFPSVRRSHLSSNWVKLSPCQSLPALASILSRLLLPLREQQGASPSPA